MRLKRLGLATTTLRAHTEDGLNQPRQRLVPLVGVSDQLVVFVGAARLLHHQGVSETVLGPLATPPDAPLARRLRVATTASFALRPAVTRVRAD
eukprot:5195965-Prymnesium_polylepis.1